MEHGHIRSSTMVLIDHQIYMTSTNEELRAYKWQLITLSSPSIQLQKLQWQLTCDLPFVNNYVLANTLYFLRQWS